MALKIKEGFKKTTLGEIQEVVQELDNYKEKFKIDFPNIDLFGDTKKTLFEVITEHVSYFNPILDVEDLENFKEEYKNGIDLTLFESHFMIKEFIDGGEDIFSTFTVYKVWEKLGFAREISSFPIEDIDQLECKVVEHNNDIYTFHTPGKVFEELKEKVEQHLEKHNIQKSEDDIIETVNILLKY